MSTITKVLPGLDNLYRKGIGDSSEELRVHEGALWTASPGEDPVRVSATPDEVSDLDTKKLRALASSSDFTTATEARVRFDNSDWVQETSSATVDGGIVVAGPTGKRYRRQLTDAVYKASMFPAIKGDYVPATNTGTDDLLAIAAAIAAMPDGYTFQFERGKNYRFGNNTITLDGSKTVHIDLNGATLWQTANKFLFDYQGAFVWTNTVSELTTVDFLLRPDYSTDSRCLRISVNMLPADIALGDILKLTSENVIPNSRPDAGDGALARMGEFVVVAGIDVVMGYVYTSAVPYEIASYTTNIKVSKVSDKTFYIGNGKISSIDAGDAGNWLNGLIKVSSTAHMKAQGLMTLKSWGPTLDLRGNFMPVIDDIFTKNADTKASNNVGYLIRCIGNHEMQASNLRGTNLRHIYATNQSYIPTSELSTRLGDYGRSMRNKITNSLGFGCNGGAFDTHSEAYMVTFDGCRSFNSYVGAVSNGEGFKIRGKQINLINCESNGHKYGIQILSQYAGGTNDVRVWGGRFEGWSSAVRTELADTGDRLLNIRFTGSDLRTTGQDLMSIATTNITFEQCRMFVDNIDFTRFVVANGAANVIANDCEYVSTRSSSTLIRLAALNGTTARIDIRRGFLICNKDIDRLIHTGTFTGGTVNITDVHVNRTITQVINTDNVSTYAYSYRTETTAGVRTVSGYIEQTVTANSTALSGVGTLDFERQLALTPTGANRTGTTLPAGLFKGQKTTWLNLSGTYTIQVNSLVTAVNSAGRAVWTGSAWINY